MSNRILIAHADADVAGQLEARLSAEGFNVFRADTIDSTRHMLHQYPDLLLLDVELAQNSSKLDLERLENEVEFSEALCVRLCSKPLPFDELKNLIPFALGSIPPPGSAEQIIEHAQTLLRIKQAEQGRNQAQERLHLQKMEVEEGLRSAAQIQHALLPSRFPATTAFSFAWQFVPCDSVGGDLFNVLQLSEDTLMAYMLDVSGHGVSSAMVTVSVYQSLSDRTSHLVKQPIDHYPYFKISSPAEVLTALDQEYPYERFEKFFTMTYMLIDLASGKIRYANGGHPPPVLIREAGATEQLDEGGTLVGMGGILPYEEAEVELEPGDRLYLYSDGITELEAPNNEMYGEERLRNFFQQTQNVSLAKSTELFMNDLRSFGAGAVPNDDISLFCLQFNGITDESFLS